MKINAPALLFFFTLSTCLHSKFTRENRLAFQTDEAFSTTTEPALPEGGCILVDCLPTGTIHFTFPFQSHDDG